MVMMVVMVGELTKGRSTADVESSNSYNALGLECWTVDPIAVA